MTVMIGIDPNEASHTAVAVDEREGVMAECTVRACTAQVLDVVELASPERKVVTNQRLGTILTDHSAQSGRTPLG